VARFNSGVSRLLFLTSAGSEGINLQKAERVLHFDMAWNPAAMEQRTGRMYRRGQEKNVEEVLLIVRDSVDEWMYELVQRKATEGKKLTSSEMLDILKR
jgi:SNF2 family DNA or RNA helicase